MAKLDVPAVGIVVERNTPTPMRDGTVLRADVYRAAKGGPFPVLLMRNPYGEPLVRSTPVLPALDAGFAVVIQHCRGTGTSDGDFVPFENEAADSLDTVRWCARQPWSNGSVAMVGGSYLGMVQMEAATQAPPELKVLVMAVTPSDYHWGVAYQQGAFQLGQFLGWHTMKSMQQLAYRAAAGEDVSADMAALMGPGAAAGFRYQPLRDAPGVSRILPTWPKWLDREERDAYWSALSYRDRRDRVTTPALHVGGWFDLFLAGTLDNYTTLSRQAATSYARRNQRLVVGPWTHGDRSGVVGEVHFGPRASDVAIQLEAFQFDVLRAGVAPGEQDLPGPPVRIFVMGDNTWREEQEWPLARTRWTRWYLHAGGGLSPAEPPEAAPPSHYTHDPHNPVPTVGGSTLIFGVADVSLLPGPRDQRAVEARPDVLSFTSDVLTEDLEVTGPVSVTLHAATSAADTDFTARLVDVLPDGRALGVVDGIVRARFRNGPDAAIPITPGQVYEYTISLIATSWVFRAGHRLRVDVASSNFPCFDRNPGNGAGAGAATEADFLSAEQTIFHDITRPSYITLPLIPR